MGDFTQVNGIITGYTGAGGAIEIPNDISGVPIVAIGPSVFFENSSVTSVTFAAPSSVTSIGRDAFYGCSGLTSITIPNSVTFIDISALAQSGLTSITIPSSLTTINEQVLSGCTALTSITIPNSITSILNFAMSGCSSLTSVTIPNSVTIIDGSAFRNCSSLTSVTIPNSVTSISGSAFQDCSSLTSVTIPDSVTSIGTDAFNTVNIATVFFKSLDYSPDFSAAFPIATITYLRNGPPCFLGDALVETPSGPKRIDTLKKGDAVLTADGRSVAIQRVHSQEVSPSTSNNPYVIERGQFGATETLLISPRHRVFVSGEGMIEARDLGLKQKKMTESWTYYNIELPNWESDNLVVHGVEVESLAPVVRMKMSLGEFVGLLKNQYGAEGVPKEVAKKIVEQFKLDSAGKIEATVVKRR